jgi:chorismate lyase/3-hydroxybenzoate synthase
MLSFHSSNTLTRPPGGAERVRLPPWVMDLFDGRDWTARTQEALRLERVSAPGHELIRITLAGARLMNADELQSRTAGAYAALFQALGPQHYPVRFWNFVPAIHEDMGGGRDRYMVFNAGRFSAFERRYGGRGAFDRNVATASAVGCGGKDLVIACLAADAPGEPVDNPRQIKPYDYSRRFGPLPPCFARATLVRPALLLTGGTASIRGEESVHVGDLQGQLAETFENLSALLCSAGFGSSLERYRELRVYHPDPAHGPRLRTLIEGALPRLERLEMVNMDLCRAELLVEIEGVARR